MKSKFEKTGKNLALLVNAFMEKGTMSISDIQSAISCNRQSAYNYLKLLQEKGCILNKYTEHNHTIYSLEQNEAADLIRYLPLTLTILRKNLIMTQLQNGPMSRNALYDSFPLATSDSPADRQSMDIALTQFNKLIKELIENGDIEESKKNEKGTSIFSLTTKNIPLNRKLNRANLEIFNDILSNISTGNPYFEELHELYQDTCLMLGYFDHDTPYYDHYLIYGKKMNGRSLSTENLRKITTLDYMHKILLIKYKTKSGKIIPEQLAVGKIIYSMEKDNFYILGKSMRGEQKNTTINVSSILEAAETDMIHDYYDSAYFKELFRDMFGISTEVPVNVCVRFDDVANIKKKLEYLTKQRSNSTMTQENESIIYTDSISGLPDFKRYLRTFGKNAHVLEPDSLKKEMEESVEKALSRYEEETNNE